MEFLPSDKELFDSLTHKRGEDDCWEWLGAANREGYGEFPISMWPLKNKKATHVALLFSGVIVPEGMFACHHCDNPPCVNPKHLFVGTHQDNMDDMRKKGRAHWQKRRAMKGGVNKVETRA